MGTTITKDGTSALANDILTLYNDWRTDRQPIQEKWERSRENYLGISLAKWKSEEAKEDWQSDTHINMTKQKVSTAVAIVLVNMMQGGQINFNLLPSAWDKLTFQMVPQQIEELTRMAIRNMKLHMEQQLTETHADRAFIKNVICCGLYGETVAKRVIGDVTRSGWRPREMPGITDLTGIPFDQIPFEPYTEKKQSIFWDYRPLWNIFRDLEDEDPRTSHGWIDRDLVAPFWLNAKKGKKYWIEDEIEEALREAKSTANQSNAAIQEEERDSLAPNLRNLTFRKRTIRYLEFWGRMPTDDVELFEAQMKEGGNLTNDISSIKYDNTDEEMGEYTEIVCGVAGRRIVMFARSEPKLRPFERAVWEDQIDEVSGSGIADNLKPTQLVLNGAIRAFEDNKKLSGNVILAVKERLLDHMPETLKPGAKVLISEEADDVRQAIQPVIVPDVGETLISLISIMERYGDEDSMIPKIQQGITSQNKETAFEVGQRLEASGNYIAMVIRNLDEQLVEPMITAYYDRNMRDPNIKIGKGPYTVKALGYSSFQNRFIQVTKLQQFLSMLLANPEVAAKYDIDKVISTIGASLDVDTANFEKPPEQIQQEQQFRQQIMQQQAATEQAKAEADIAKTQADAKKSESDAIAQQEKLKNDRAKLVLELEKVKQGQAGAAPATGANGGQIITG